MAKYRGSKGSVTISAGVVGELRSWEFTASRDYIEGTSMPATAQSGGDLDIPGGRGRLTARFDYGDVAQAALFDQVISDAAPTVLPFVGLIETGKQISCNILCTSAPIRGAVKQGHFEVTFDFVSDGAISIAWA